MQYTPHLQQNNLCFVDSTIYISCVYSIKQGYQKTHSIFKSWYSSQTELFCLHKRFLYVVENDLLITLNLLYRYEIPYQHNVHCLLVTGTHDFRHECLWYIRILSSKLIHAISYWYICESKMDTFSIKWNIQFVVS